MTDTHASLDADRHPRHPIAVVAARTGLTQDLLRAWERRYQAVRPARSAAGQRLYSDADVERLRLLGAVTAAGRAIAAVAALPTPELARLLDEDASARELRAAAPAASGDVARESAIVERALGLVRELDADGLHALLRRGVAAHGVPAFLERVVAPLLGRIGDGWHAGRISIGQEHLASAVISDLIAEVTRALPGQADAPRLLVATPAGSRHVIGAALVAAVAATEGWRVLFLGADLPAVEIAAVAERREADAVAVSVTYAEHPRVTLAELRALRQRVPSRIPLVVGGRAIRGLETELAALGIEIGGTLDELRTILELIDAEWRARDRA